MLKYKLVSISLPLSLRRSVRHAMYFSEIAPEA